MPVLCLVPYLFFFLGIGFRLSGVGPAMLTWAMVMLGALSGGGIAFALLAVGESIGLVVTAGLPALVVGAKTAKDLTYPFINDVSTDVERPPRFSATWDQLPKNSRDKAFPARNAAIIRAAYPELCSLKLDMCPQQVLNHASALMKLNVHWHVTRRDDHTGQIEAEVTTPFLGFVDDVILRAERDGTHTRIDMRSKSREGLVDGGANATRIKLFMTQLAAADRLDIASENCHFG